MILELYSRKVSIIGIKQLLTNRKLRKQLKRLLILTLRKRALKTVDLRLCLVSGKLIFWKLLRIS
jgi:hypothetical protein